MSTAIVNLSAVVAAVLFALLYTCLRSIFHRNARLRELPLPPGLPRLPILGNYFNIPTVRPWETYRDLCSKLGTILHIEVFGQHVVVLGSPEIILEYLEKGSLNTSDRKQTPVLSLVGADLNFGLMPYGQWWRRHRRAFWQHFRPDAVLGYQQAQCQIARRFLRALLQDPSELVEHIQYTALGSLMKVIYDIDVVRETDFRTYSSVLHSVQEGVGEVFQPGSSLIEYFPVLRWLPSFLPGGSYVRRASKWRSSAYHLREEPFVRAQKTFQSTTDGPETCIVHRLLKRVAASASESAALVSEETEIAENVAAVSLSAGSDTTYSLLQAFFLAMSQHPDVVKKAQEELDSVVGNNRLPDFGDQDKLVYLTAIVKETLRWHVVVPFGVPHCTTRDDELRGYYVPANTVLLPNIWACLHDPEAYQDPEDFRPERFIRDGKLDPSVRDPSAFAFGFGRRVCPGRHFAEAALFINIASVLHVFDIGPPLDGAGKPIKIQYKMTNGFLSYPEDCRCSIVPRSAQAERSIREAQ